MNPIEAAKIATCIVFKMRIENMTRRIRATRISWPRQMAMALAFEMSDCTLSEVGRGFQRDHGTVSHALNVVKDQRDISEDARRAWAQCVSGYERLTSHEPDQIATPSTG